MSVGTSGRSVGTTGQPDASVCPGRPVQRRVQVVGAAPDGAYTRLALDAGGDAGALPAPRPGQFVALAVGDAPTATLLRRAFSVAHADDYRWELLIAAHGPGSTWLTRRRPGDVVDLVGPLGRPFPAPAPGAACVLVAGGYGAAPMVWWARELIAAGHPVAVVLGAGDAGRLAEVDAAQSLGVPVLVTTDDGSAGRRGRVTDVLPDALDALAALAAGPGGSGSAGPAGSAGAGAAERTPVEVYACGPMAMLRAVTDRAGELDRSGGGQAPRGLRVWCAVEEAMACGIGVCMTCVLPVRGADGTTRMVRSCIDGPTFAGDAVRWDALTATRSLLGGTAAGASVPADCWGAAR